METLKLSEREQTYYGELFQSCDVDGTGRVTGGKAADLFRSSGLSQDVLVQITELCGAKRLGHFGRSQFYIALKLIAAAQGGVPVKLDSQSLNSGMDVRLPRFARANGQEKWRSQHTPPSVDQDPSSDSARPGPQQAGQLPPPPAAAKKSHARTLSGQYRSLVTDGAQQYSSQQSRDELPHDTKSPTFSPKQSPPTSPGVKMKLGAIGKQQTAPASVGTVSIASSIPNTGAPYVSMGHPCVPTSAAAAASYTNSVHDEGWASFEDEESHGLLDTGTKTSWEHLDHQTVDSSSMSSEAESVDDVWSILKEQREYYLKQFKTMQPDLNGVIVGSVAKEFFEKSKLPVHELSKIWQLSDLNRDGALSLDEFCIAMHLVVLRRNDIELPDHLPISLMPYSALTNDEPFAADLPPGSTLKRLSPVSPQTGQWTRNFPSESPSSSGLSSPAPKPVSFEFPKPVATDPDSKIIHPVAVRMSPDGHPLPPDIVDRTRTVSDPVMYLDPAEQAEVVGPSKQRASLDSYNETLPNDSMTSKLASVITPLHGRPRPVPKKTAPVPSTGHLQPLPAPPSGQTSAHEQAPADWPVAGTSSVSSGDPAPVGGGGSSLAQGPPRLPPRPVQSHGRSFSVDLKLKTDSSGSALLPPPAVPPRISPKDKKGGDSLVFGFADFAVFDPISSQEDLNQIDSPPPQLLPNTEKHRRAVSLDFRQLGIPPPTAPPDIGDTGDLTAAAVSKAVTEDVKSTDDEEGAGDKHKAPLIARQPSRDKRELLIAIKTHKERNSMLSRLNSELNQELQEVMEQRIALEIQLEHLRPFSS